MGCIQAAEFAVGDFFREKLLLVAGGFIFPQAQPFMDVLPAGDMPGKGSVDIENDQTIFHLFFLYGLPFASEKRGVRRAYFVSDLSNAS
jgi:hypothetical protein